MSERKFYKTEIKVTILSEEPLQPMSLEELHYITTEGDCSGKLETISEQELTGKQAADALKEQGSDPEFFQLDEDGIDI